MLYPNPNMLLRIAQGDAYAMACEYCNRHPDEPEHQELLRFERYLPHPVHKIKPGCYTDDTQMSIAVAETLIDAVNPNLDWDDDLNTDEFAAHFVTVFKRDKRQGYSRGLQTILEQSRSGWHLQQLIRPDSNKNGACMRAVPIGVLKNPKDVMQIAARQARITHDTYGGVVSAEAVALMSHYALYEAQDFSHMYEWLVNQHPALIYLKEPWSGSVEQGNRKEMGVGLVTAWAVCTLLQECNSLLDIMRRIIEWGGDTDTVAAVAWGIASARYQDEVLPDFFERDLEHQSGSKFKGEFLKELGRKLMEAYAC